MSNCGHYKDFRVRSSVFCRIKHVPKWDHYLSVQGTDIFASCICFLNRPLRDLLRLAQNCVIQAKTLVSFSI